MKRLLPLVLFVAFLSTSASAQLAEKKTSAIQLGYGYPSVMSYLGQMLKFGFTLGNDETASSSFSYKGFGPIHFRYDYMIGGRVGLGLSSNFEKGKFTLVANYTDLDENYVTSTSTFDYSSINAMARMNIHFLKRNEKMDIYYGFGVGYAHTRAKFQERLDGAIMDPDDQQFINEFNDYLNSAFKFFPVAIEEVFGMKWAFSQNAGMYMEVGYSKAFCQLGVFAKLGNSKGYYRSNWKYY